eukprot:CAMPEP_0113691262 /NCGR_PEP_ID=MMETSP0038_2-20120614/18319_1 /TAXON_ID=2898 /ORGANISM="Cryptomonas paramecium" /LENGTH=78 /DNA_ID=CAMNT_0000612819 /DNA_START=255 /DNA_END=487 /DNA_ORIENTATION=+ /assembly_acc=CAM_ASM_000170
MHMSRALPVVPFAIPPRDSSSRFLLAIPPRDSSSRFLLAIPPRDSSSRCAPASGVARGLDHGGSPSPGIYHHRRELQT